MGKLDDFIRNGRIEPPVTALVAAKEICGKAFGVDEEIFPQFGNVAVVGKFLPSVVG